MGSDKDVWAMLVWIVNMILVFLVAGEIIYLILKAYRNKSYMNDSEFCQRHLFNRRKTPRIINEYRMSQRRRIIEDTQELEPLIPPSPGENEGSKNLDDVYVNLIIHTGRSRLNLDMERMDKLRILEEYVKSPENSMKINKLEDLFLPNKDSKDKVPHKILILGCPGIGKTLLCKKLLRELSSGSESVQHEPRKFVGCCGREVNQSKPQFLHLFLFHFRNFNSEETKRMSLQTLIGKYSEGKLDKETLQYFLDHPEEVLLVFDGLDEFKNHKERIKDGMKHAGNGVSDDMPFAALYVKLVTGIFVNGATVITTTRPYAIDSVGGLEFDRTVEILGFSTKEVKKYCTKFFHNDKSVMEKIWNHVKSNLNLLHFCCIPANCFIIFSYLKEIIELSTTPLQGVVLPTTLTEIYEKALRLFIFKHHPEYQGETVTTSDFTSHGTFSSEIEDTLSKLEALAVKGIDERRLVFEVEEVQGIENCGLLNRMRNVQIGPLNCKRQYCFIHLTMQEFVAARGIAKMDPEDLQELISSQAEDGKWHLVIQFVAGLLKGKEAVVNEMFVKNLKDALLSKGSMALLMTKCLYEANDISSVKRAAAELKSNSNFTNHVDFLLQSVTPVDCAAIVYFLKHIDNLEYLDVSINPLGDGGCSELAKLVEAGGPHKLDLTSCDIGDQGLITILKAMETAETCNLSQLDISYNGITVKGYSCLCDALMGGKYTITGLVIDNILVNTDILLQLCNALKHRNCNLSMLHFIGSRGIDSEYLDVERAYINLSSALVDKDCKLTDLALWFESIKDPACMSHVWEALKNENCKLTKLKLCETKMTDKEILCICEVLKHVNCRFTELHLISFLDYLIMREGQNPNGIFLVDNDYHITDLGVSYLSDTLKHKDCKLTRLGMSALSIKNLTKKGIDDLQNAITHDNCKLQEFLYINDNNYYVGRNTVTFTCHIVDSNGHKVLARKDDFSQYEEITLSSLVYDEENYCDRYKIKIER